jgi:hypothetical protein
VKQETDTERRKDTIHLNGLSLLRLSGTSSSVSFEHVVVTLLMESQAASQSWRDAALPPAYIRN